MGKKAVIVLLVLCALLFLLALGSNWLPSAKGQKEDFSLNDYGWLNRLDEWFRPFQKKLSLSRLKPRNCTVIGQGRYKLINNKTCVVAIDPVEESSDKDKMNARALVINTTRKVTFLIPCKKESQGRGLGIGKKMVLNPAVRIPGAVLNTPVPLKVQVAFSPMNNSGEDGENMCEQKSPPKLMVFDDGGILKLTCPACKANRTVEVVLE